MIFTESGEYIPIDEASKADSLASSISAHMNELKLFKKAIEDGTNDSFTKNDTNKALYKIKNITSTILKFIGDGISGAAAVNTFISVKTNKMVKGTNGKGAFLVDGFIRDAIQFVCGILISILGKAIKNSNKKADIEASKSVLKDLERMRDKTEDEELKKYINNKIDAISDLLKQYDEEVKKK